MYWPPRYLIRLIERFVRICDVFALATCYSLYLKIFCQRLSTNLSPELVITVADPFRSIAHDEKLFCKYSSRNSKM